MSAFKDISGQRFGRYTAIRYVKEPRKWECICDCGCVRLVDATALRSGHSKSCGCLSRDMTSSRVLHGHARKRKRTSTYKCWYSMIQRTTNSKSKFWKDYGGRGIFVCDSWLSFDVFLKDMGERPVGMTLDRIDNNAGYNKSNCRWATRSEQARNTRKATLLTVNGVTQPLAAWAEQHGLHQNVVRNRIKRCGWTTEKAIFTAVMGR